MPIYGYTQDPNDSTKQVPVKRTGLGFCSYAECPANESIVKRPSYVNINQAGTYAFAYDSASAAVGTSTTRYITGSVVQSDAGGIRLDINPVAWRRTDAADAVGQITFVYVRVS